MHVGETLAQLNCLGITLMTKGDKLCLQPGSQVPPVLITTLRQHKAEILAYLRQQPQGPEGEYRLVYPGQGGPSDPELAEIAHQVQEEAVYSFGVRSWRT